MVGTKQVTGSFTAAWADCLRTPHAGLPYISGSLTHRGGWWTNGRPSRARFQIYLSYFALGGAEVLYLFKQTSFADHAPNEDILKALGIAPRPSS